MGYGMEMSEFFSSLFYLAAKTILFHAAKIYNS